MMAKKATIEPAATVEPARDAAIMQLFAEQYLPLLRLTSLLVDEPATAEDVVQESFVRLHRSWDGIRDLDAAPAWLRSTALNLARSGLRRRQVFGRLRVVPSDDAPSAESHAVLSEDRRAVVEALRALPRRQREVLVLRYYAECSEAEIADLLDIAPGSVKTHAHRGLETLRAALEDRT
jgi:RNA polymerase sigma-70 factor (sigma-E family)